VLLVGTTDHLEDLDRQFTLAEDVQVTAIAGGTPTGYDGAVYALLDGERVVRVGEFDVAPVARLEAAEGQSMAADGGMLVVGLQRARLVRVDPSSGSVSALRAFESLEGRETWENPAGPTPDLRSLAMSDSGAWLANVHVGGVWRSTDRGATWANVIPPESDVHEVAAGRDGRVVAAAAVGVGWSTDDGVSWDWTSDGLHARYCRAVAIDGRTVYVTASTGPTTDDGRLYRGPLGGPFEPCAGGLPESFAFNLDTGSVAARDGQVALGARDGRVWRSADAGDTFGLVTERVGRVRVLRFA
jgi:hypothetical protein